MCLKRHNSGCSLRRVIFLWLHLIYTVLHICILNRIPNKCNKCTQLYFNKRCPSPHRLTTCQYNSLIYLSLPHCNFTSPFLRFLCRNPPLRQIQDSNLSNDSWVFNPNVKSLRFRLYQDKHHNYNRLSPSLHHRQLHYISRIDNKPRSTYPFPIFKLRRNLL